MKPLILFLLIPLFGICQKKSTEKPRFRLFAFSFHHKSKPAFGSDTVKVNLVVTHKVKTWAPSQTIGGYAIRVGRKTRYLDCDMKPLPMYVVVNRVKYIP